jgi:drug/metabolite transporter (DMT)-like permease
MLLVWERGGPATLLTVGAGLGAASAFLFSIRDNFVRWAATENDVPGVVAATASLASASALILLVVVARRSAVVRVGRAARPFLLSGLIYGGAYACLFSAFDRGRVTVVAPLYATESLWAVVVSLLILRRAERVGLRLLVAAALVVGGGALISSFR